VATQPLPGERDGLYGGTVNYAECDREKMITFLGAHPAQAGAFVEALNSDSTLYWSGGRALTVVDIPVYLRELTPVLLRLDTRVTNHGFDGAHFTTLQSVLQAGTALLVDAHGVPRVRGYSGSPLTGPNALAGAPKLVGTPWTGYRPGALAAVHPSTVTITNFVLVDVVTGHPFNRPAGTTGDKDTPHTQAVAPPGPGSTATTNAQKPELDIDGTYLVHLIIVGACNAQQPRDYPLTVTHQGDTLKIGNYYTGALHSDGSFELTSSSGYATMTGVFASEGGRTVIRDGTIANKDGACFNTFVATKQ
jgi:hypothetical protein